MPIEALTIDYLKSYNSLFVSLQRLGYFPNISNTLDESLRNNDLVITVNSRIEYPPDEVKKISSFLERGGKLLILEEHPDTNSPVKSLINNLGLKYILNSSDISLSLQGISIENSKAENTGEETSIKDQAEPDNPFPNFSAYSMGKGGLFIIHNSGSYNDINLGIANAIPNNDQLKNLRLVYKMIPYIVDEN